MGCILGASLPLAFATDYLFGYGQSDISPTPEEIATKKVFMGAYGFLGTRGHATGVHDKVWIRAVAMDDGTTPLIVATGDLPGATHLFINEIRNGAATRLNV